MFGEIPSQITEYIDTHTPDMPDISGKADVTYVDEGLALKVDKEEGKCLIDEQTAESFRHEDTEYLYALTDNAGRILCAFDGNGAAEMHGTVKTESAEIQSAETEYLYALTDNAGRILAGIDGNGRLVFGEIPETIAEYVQAEISGKVDKEEGKCLVDEQTEQSVSWSDTEYLQAVTDADGRILEYTDDDGTKNFPAGIKAGNAEMSDVKAGSAEIAGTLAEILGIPDMPEYVWVLMDNNKRVLQTIDENGAVSFNVPVAFKSTVSGIPMDGADNSDWSNAESLAIPEPRCAVVNFSGINAMPTSKTEERNAVMEFWDRQGNYFRKKITCAAQGSSSMNYPKKNVSFDLLNDDGSEFELKIGNWVAQDGFHLKAYYTDFFRGVAVPSYKFWDEILCFNGIETDRAWKKALHVTEGITPTGGTLQGMELQLDGGALCHPDGFPCLVYLNGVFYGIFSWQIKKNRKNYHMDKSNVTHIHIDGDLYTHNFWDGAVNWTRFEVRNPNKLYTMDGAKYDGDNPRELIDATSENYDPNNNDHVRSAEVKAYIQDFVSAFQEVKRLYSVYTGNPTPENLAAVKAKYEEIFDVENQRDYLIFSDVVNNRDGFAKNWQWTTYDGVKWWVNAYDLDQSFGGHWMGLYLFPPLTAHITTSTSSPTGYITLLYHTELEAKYAELREAGIIDERHIISLLDDWTKRIGTANYELEYEKWPESPCILNYTDSIYRVKKWIDTEIANMDTVYHYTN